MASYSPALPDLCACFRGEVPKHADWLSIIGLANQTLTTPALMDIAARFESEVPEDARRYIRFIFERNLTRNDRLAAQLVETVEAINDRGITPTLFKGAATLATAPQSSRGARLMTDLDLMVQPDEIEAAMKAITAIGYCEHERSPPYASEWWIELKRSDDVGALDLHRALPGSAIFSHALGNLAQYRQIVQVGRGKAYVPNATCQALILLAHDQFQDNDYWTGNIDLRHLLQLRDLATSLEGIDWKELLALMPDRLARNAVETQLVALSSLLRVDIPAGMRSGFIPRLQHQRRLLQTRFPALRLPMLSIGLLDYWNHRAHADRLRLQDGLKPAPARKWAPPKLSTLRFILGLSNNQRPGKA
jgi:putative nucleotidyltransferase-like protein